MRLKQFLISDLYIKVLMDILRGGRQQNCIVTVMHTAGHSAVVVAERLGGYLQGHGHGFTCRCFYTLICLQLFHGHDYVAVVPR